jgi:hypothetical protein
VRNHLHVSLLTELIFILLHGSINISLLTERNHPSPETK